MILERYLKAQMASLTAFGIMSTSSNRFQTTASQRAK
jgi:hypothetical protein